MKSRPSSPPSGFCAPDISPSHVMLDYKNQLIVLTSERPRHGAARFSGMPPAMARVDRRHNEPAYTTLTDFALKSRDGDGKCSSRGTLFLL
jgi:hypothetical protein